MLTITDIYWERIFLHIEFEGALDKQLYLRRNTEFISLKQKKTNKGEGTSETVLNMATVVNRMFLENGLWKLGYFDSKEQPQTLDEAAYNRNRPRRIKRSPRAMRLYNEPFRESKLYEDRSDPMQFCEISGEVAEKLDDLDKVFRYSEINYAYTVNFTTFTIDELHMHLCINSFFMIKHETWDRRRHGYEGGTFTEGTKRRALHAKKHFMNALYALCCLFYRNKKKNILLLTEVEPDLRGNLLVIYERIKERGLEREFNITVSCRESVGRRNSTMSWVKVVARIAKAHIIIVDNFVPLLTYLHLDKETKIVQVWHAGAGFKGVGYMRFGKESSPFPAESVHKKYALALAPSESLVKVFEEVFGIEEEAFFPVGMPRLDGYLEPAKIESFKEDFYKKYPELQGKKIILFAPTYRGSGQGTAYYDYTKLDFKQLYDFCGDEYVFLLKMHPFIKDTMEYYDGSPLKLTSEQVKYRIKPDLSSYASRIFDFTSYPNINELFYLTDIFVTDYSSAYYEYSVFKRPVIFYTYDRVLYENIRGVYQKISDSAPGKICDTFEELITALKNEDFELEKTVTFSESHFPDKLEGATDKLLDRLLCL